MPRIHDHDLPAVKLVLVIHHHQPAGNFDRVIEHCLASAYAPFLSTLDHHPEIKVGLHYSGSLLDWIARHEPGFLERLQRMVQRGQVELLGGGYYEPILPIIPYRHKVEQIRRLNDRIEELFALRPRGMWLAERVWEPHLADSIVEAGLEYVVLDDSHFAGAGLLPGELRSHYMTEDEGHTLRLLPGSRDLRYAIPFKTVDANHGLLREWALSGGGLLVFADDCEKFGVWPGTNELAYGKPDWLNRFLDMLGRTSFVETLTPSEAIDQLPSSGTVYLPAASYAELMEWALPPSYAREAESLRRDIEALGEGRQQRMLKRFTRAGFFRNFLVKYPEANDLHKRMLRACRRFDRIEEQVGDEGRATLEALFERLLRAQTGDPYWHGVFGGLYTPHLRALVEDQLVAIEHGLDRLQRGEDSLAVPVIEQEDLDCDGTDEVWLRGERLGLMVAPRRGGSLRIIDDYVAGRNVISVVRRREETYHIRLHRPDYRPAASGAANIKDRNQPGQGDPIDLKDLLAYDWHGRWCCVDHFLPPHLTLRDLERAVYLDQGDFVLEPFQVDHPSSGVASGATRLARLVLSREGSLNQRGRIHPLRVSKRFELAGGARAVVIVHAIENLGSTALTVEFACEWNVNPTAGISPEAKVVLTGHPTSPASLLARDERPAVPGLRVDDGAQGLSLRLSWSRPAHLYRYPVQTVSHWEGGLEAVYQGLCLTPKWRLDLPPRQPVEIITRFSLAPCDP